MKMLLKHFCHTRRTELRRVLSFQMFLPLPWEGAVQISVRVAALEGVL